MHTYKRSRSEDNILKATEDLEEDYALPLTPQILGEEMSKDDAFYTPSNMCNPFDEWKLYGKILGTPKLKESFGFELPSPSDPFTPPCTPCTPDNTLGRRRKHPSAESKSQSLPSSPVLLRKAAERLHQESLHGSASRRHSAVNQNRFSFSMYFPRSKSALFPEALAQKLQYEIDGHGDNNVENIKTASSQRQKRRVMTKRQLSADCPSVTESDSNISESVTFGLSASWDIPYPNNVRDYISSQSSSESFLSIDEQVTSPVFSPNSTETPTDQNFNSKVSDSYSKIAFSDTVTIQESTVKTRISNDGSVIETAL